MATIVATVRLYMFTVEGSVIVGGSVRERYCSCHGDTFRPTRRNINTLSVPWLGAAWAAAAAATSIIVTLRDCCLRRLVTAVVRRHINRILLLWRIRPFSRRRAQHDLLLLNFIVRWYNGHDDYDGTGPIHFLYRPK
jgi:hypothetical protein